MNKTTKASIIGVLLAVVFAFALSACSDDATIASRNVSKAADNFEVNRRVIFYNGITNQYILTIEGLCSIKHDVQQWANHDQLEVTCKTGIGDGQIKKHFLGLSHNVTYFVEQVSPSDVSLYHYRVTFKPQTIIPDIDARGSGTDLPKAQ